MQCKRLPVVPTSGGFVRVKLHFHLVPRVFRVMTVGYPQMSVQVVGAFKWLVAALPPVATWYWAEEGPNPVRVPWAVPPVVLLAFGLCKVIFATSTAFLVSFLKYLVVSKVMLESLFGGKS